MRKTNCWQHRRCGRNAAGTRKHDYGICPAATATVHNGKNGGQAAGRYCWKVAGTFCGGEIQGTFAEKFMNCLTCDFFQLVKREEGADFLA